MALRGGGAIITINPATGDILARRAVCSAPRGIAYDGANDALVVACAGGELVTLGASELGGSDVVSRFVEPDLRDVAIIGGEIRVSHLRGSEVLTLDASGAVLQRQRPGELVGTNLNGVERRHQPSTAWRMLPMPGGGVVMSNQFARSSGIVLDDPSPEGGGAYGAQDCGDMLGAVRAHRRRQGRGTRPRRSFPATVTASILP